MLHPQRRESQSSTFFQPLWKLLFPHISDLKLPICLFLRPMSSNGAMPIENPSSAPAMFLMEHPSTSLPIPKNIDMCKHWKAIRTKASHIVLTATDGLGTLLHNTLFAVSRQQPLAALLLRLRVYINPIVELRLIFRQLLRSRKKIQSCTQAGIFQSSHLLCDN